MVSRPWFSSSNYFFSRCYNSYAIYCPLASFVRIFQIYREIRPCILAKPHQRLGKRALSEFRRRAHCQHIFRSRQQRRRPLSQLRLACSWALLAEAQGRLPLPGTRCPTRRLSAFPDRGASARGLAGALLGGDGHFAKGEELNAEGLWTSPLAKCTGSLRKQCQRSVYFEE